MIHTLWAKLACASHAPKARILAALLLLAHLPYLVVYWTGLWRLAHYQFFPFAFAAFGWLCYTRRSSTVQPWSVVSRLLIGFDVLCLATGVALNSPWIVTFGLMAWLLAWCLNSRYEVGQRNSAYLILLPLMTVRLPLNFDEAAIHWLQRITTSIASQFLNQLGMLHAREGNIIEFPGKSFLVAEACSGVQSLFTILFLVALIVCLRRHSFVHAVLLFCAGFVFAGAMNVVRVMTIAVVWDQSARDLSTGLTHEMLGYCCLGIAAALLMSADVCIAFLFERVPDLLRHEHGATDHFRNPVIVFWNFLLVSRSVSDSRIDESEQTEDAIARDLPSGRDLLNPRYWFSFLTGFFDSWLRSRSYRQLLAGSPFISAVIIGVGLTFWLRHGSEASVIGNYQQGVMQAQQNSDWIREEVCLKALCGFRRQESDYRFRLGLSQIRQGRTKDGLSNITSLTPKETNGYAPARMWLVQQARQPEPLLPLDRETLELHLLAVLKQQPENSEAHELLSKVYFERREFQLAERHLEQACRFNRELNLQLAILKRTMNRDPASVRSAAQLAVDALAKKLEQDRGNTATRITLAEAQRISGDDVAARETLVSGLQQSEDPSLKKALANFDLTMIDRRLNESPLHRDGCVPLSIAALKLDPSNVAGLQMLGRLQSLGAAIPADSVRSSVAYWEAAVANQPENQELRILLSQLHVTTGNFQPAIEILRPVIASRPELRTVFARLLLQAGHRDEAAVILETLCAESLAALKTENGNDRAAAGYAEALLTLGRSSEARDFLRTRDRNAETSSEADRLMLESLYGHVCLAEYDRLAGFQSAKFDLGEAILNEIPASADSAMLLELLQESLKCRGTTIGAINRLALLSLSKHAASQDAERMIRQLRLEGEYGMEVLSKLGMFALLLKKYETAYGYLEQANAQSRGIDPMILNNLAIATLRSKNGNPGKALELANQTLAKLPQNTDALTTRGEVYLALGRWTEAVADLTEAMQHRPASAEVHRLLQKAYTGIPDLDMAAEHGRKAAELEAAQASR